MCIRNNIVTTFIMFIIKLFQKKTDIKGFLSSSYDDKPICSCGRNCICCPVCGKFKEHMWYVCLCLKCDGKFDDSLCHKCFDKKFVKRYW